jgi:hypothetical protein
VLRKQRNSLRFGTTRLKWKTALTLVIILLKQVISNDRTINDIRSFISYVLQDKRILRSYGYSLKGQRAKFRRRYSPWGPRITAIPIISYNEGLLDVGLYEGHVNGETFLDFVDAVLTPCLLPFNGFNPRSIVILGKVFFLAAWFVHNNLLSTYNLYSFRLV